jgi:hypothetical protein
MDIVEFAERFIGVDLPEWQKKHIKTLYEMSTNEPIRIVMPKNAGRHQAYIYMNQKELILNGKTTDCK